MKEMHLPQEHQLVVEDSKVESEAKMQTIIEIGQPVSLENIPVAFRPDVDIFVFNLTFQVGQSTEPVPNAPIAIELLKKWWDKYKDKGLDYSVTWGIPKSKKQAQVPTNVLSAKQLANWHFITDSYYNKFYAWFENNTDFNIAVKSEFNALKSEILKFEALLSNLATVKNKNVSHISIGFDDTDVKFNMSEVLGGAIFQFILDVSLNSLYELVNGIWTKSVMT
jgi:hypothetical protein